MEFSKLINSNCLKSNNNFPKNYHFNLFGFDCLVCFKKSKYISIIKLPDNHPNIKWTEKQLNECYNFYKNIIKINETLIGFDNYIHEPISSIKQQLIFLIKQIIIRNKSDIDSFNDKNNIIKNEDFDKSDKINHLKNYIIEILESYKPDLTNDINIIKISSEKNNKDDVKDDVKDLKLLINKMSEKLINIDYDKLIALERIYYNQLNYLINKKK